MKSQSIPAAKEEPQKRIPGAPKYTDATFSLQTPNPGAPSLEVVGDVKWNVPNEMRPGRGPWVMPTHHPPLPQLVCTNKLKEVIGAMTPWFHPPTLHKGTVLVPFLGGKVQKIASSQGSSQDCFPRLAGGADTEVECGSRMLAAL